MFVARLPSSQKLMSPRRLRKYCVNPSPVLYFVCEFSGGNVDSSNILATSYGQATLPRISTSFFTHLSSISSYHVMINHGALQKTCDTLLTLMSSQSQATKSTIWHRSPVRVLFRAFQAFPVTSPTCDVGWHLDFDKFCDKCMHESCGDVYDQTLCFSLHRLRRIISIREKKLCEVGRNAPLLRTLRHPQFVTSLLLDQDDTILKKTPKKVLLYSSSPEENFGGNLLLENSMSLSFLCQRITTDLTINIATGFDQSFS